MEHVRLAASKDAATLYLHGDIGWEVTPAAVAQALKGAVGKPLTVSVDSYGGDAFNGIAIHNMIARHDGPKTVIVESIAASAASVIAMAGDRIIMPSNTFMMIHNASGFAMGPAEVQRDVADLLDNISSAARRVYAARTGLSEEEVGAMMDAETWMTAEEAVAKGFATETAAPADIRLDARRLAAFAHVPAALAASPPGSPPAHPPETIMNAPAAPAPAPAPTLAAPAPAPINPLAGIATLSVLEDIAGRAKLGADWVLAQMKASATEQQARDAAIDAMAARASVPAMSGAIITRDARETRVELMTNAIMHRGNPAVKLEEGAREFRGMTMLDMARESLAAGGVKVRGKTAMEIAEMALSGGRYRMEGGEHTTSDLPNVFANVMNKTLRNAYEESPRTFQAWANPTTLPDFKQGRLIALSAAPSLMPMNEAGEVTYGQISDGAELWNLVRYGRGIGISYVSIVNDDLSAMTRLPAMFGSAAARLESDVVYAQLLANGNLADGGALFNATVITTTGGHDNLTSGGTSALTADAAGIKAVGALEEKINKQVAPGTSSPLNLRGGFLLMPPALGTIGRQLFSGAVINSQPNTQNVYMAQYQPIIEGRLQLGMTIGATAYTGSATAFYVVAAKGSIDTITYGYLEGQNGPVIQSTIDFDTDGMKLKVNHNFGAKAVDYRGLAKSAGA